MQVQKGTWLRCALRNAAEPDRWAAHFYQQDGDDLNLRPNINEQDRPQSTDKKFLYAERWIWRMSL